jgi:hypothetical protein
MMTITREDDFVSRAEGEWHNTSERLISISLWVLHPGQSQKQLLQQQFQFAHERVLRGSLAATLKHPGFCILSIGGEETSMEEEEEEPSTKMTHDLRHV